MASLDGRICLVTGASRGIGKGIAVQLLTYGATVYVTGRNETTLAAIGEEANSRSTTGVGKCIPVVCDHSNDESVKQIFNRIKEENNGRLDLLVNNAYSAVTFIMENATKNFWDQPENTWDEINLVGLRNHFQCSQHAAKLMVPRRHGLIINISSIGGVAYFQTAAYGVGKAGKDRMARDCAMELAPYNVCYLSLWPGLVKTELITANKSKLGEGARFDWMFKHGESTEFPGKAIVHLLADPKVMQKTGQIVFTTDLAAEYGFHDIDGSDPMSMRSVPMFLSIAKVPMFICQLFPQWLKISLNVWKFILSRAKPDMKTKQMTLSK